MRQEKTITEKVLKPDRREPPCVPPTGAGRLRVELSNGKTNTEIRAGLLRGRDTIEEVLRGDKTTGEYQMNSEELKSIVVTIQRHTILEASASTSIQRKLEDPSNLVIHRKGKAK